MGFLKKLKEGLDSAREQVMQNLEEVKQQAMQNIEETKQQAMQNIKEAQQRILGQQQTSRQRTDDLLARNRTLQADIDEQDDSDDDDEPRIQLGKFENGVLEIREGIRKIDSDSLEDYKHLRKIIFPASLEELQEECIYDHKELEELDFSRVTQLSEIPESFVYDETRIKEFVIPNGVTTVGNYFLSEANSDTKIYVPETVRKIGSINGQEDNNLIVYLFAHGLDIEDLERDVKTLYVLPDDYADYAEKLKDCDSEARLREMPEEVMNIYPTTKPEPKPTSAPAFQAAQQDDAVASDGMFSARLEMLIKSALQDGVLTDQERAVLKKRAEAEGEDWDEVAMIIDARLAEIQAAKGIATGSAPSGAPTKEAEDEPSPSQTSETNISSTPETLKEASNEIDGTGLIVYEGGKTEVLSADLTEIADEEYLWRGIVKLVLPSGIKRIGKRAFYNNAGLEEVDFSKCSKLEIIGDSAFYGCKGLKVVDLSKCKNVKIICKEVFSEGEMKEIVIPDSVEIIGEGSGRYGHGPFDSCKKLKTIVMPASLKEIKSLLGNQLEQLKKIDFSKVKNLKTFPKIVDYGCDKLKELIIPQGVIEIEDDALDGISKLQRIFLPPSLETFGDTDQVHLSIYCFSPSLEELEPIVYGWDDNDQEDDEELDEIDDEELKQELMQEQNEKKSGYRNKLFVLPQYLKSYIEQREAEGIPEDVLPIEEMPEEYRYYYDN